MRSWQHRDSRDSLFKVLTLQPYNCEVISVVLQAEVDAEFG